MDTYSKIAVLGPIPRDTISTYKNEIIKKYGCVTHPTIALSKILGSNGEVIPISNIHKIDHQPLVSLFSGYKNIDQRGLKSDDDRGTIIHLDFIDQNNRIEKQMACMKPIKDEDLFSFKDADAFVFVPITDFEISLSALKYAKDQTKAITIYDAHGSTTAMNIQGDRHRKYWVDIEEWLPYIDVLKMNLEESQCCWFENEFNLDSIANYDENKTDHLDNLAEFVLAKGTSYLYVTLDSRGCVVYSKKEGTIQKDFIKSVPVETVIDTTGCGDSFAGGLAYGFVKDANDHIKAAQYANILGALRTQGTTFDVFDITKNDMDDMVQKYY
ncbi:carbohydrate kinase family protein [Aquimarina sp. M1]